MNKIFVFGSNESGIHGAGAAKDALKRHGAVYGQGYGLQGNSFAIPTKDYRIEVLPIEIIKEYINDFKEFAAEHSEEIFYVTKVGTGLSGYNDEDIAPLFNNSPLNCIFHSDWKKYLKGKYQYFKKQL
jgi:hypothetical protein